MATQKSSARKTKPPWRQSNPKPPAKRKSLTRSQKAKAKASARKAGRPYPNLVDNMKVARKTRDK